MTAIASARSFLFVPANRPERYAKALASGADAVIIDLEDAVAPDAKVAARQQLADGFDALHAAERARVLVRINAAGTPWHADDLALVDMLSKLDLGGVVLPKAEAVADVVQLATRIGTGCAVLPLIESAAGLAALDVLAACSGVTRLVFGNLDFQADLGMACGPDEAELQPVRLALVLASRRAGLPAPVDGVTPSTSDTA
ncbi:MAG: CoA ester lyase, partial [Comamonadaceae bacterium]